jgi:toxin ParE1/3/4
MKKQFKLVWTRQAQEDLRSIRNYIARDAPFTAVMFIERLRSAVNRLRQFPESGHEVPEMPSAELREIVFGQYRIIYRFRDGLVEILNVLHGARLFDESDY